MTASFTFALCVLTALILAGIWQLGWWLAYGMFCLMELVAQRLDARKPYVAPLACCKACSMASEE